MSKSTRMSKADLDAMGLEEDGQGNYKPKSRGIRQENIDKAFGDWLNTPLPEDAKISVKDKWDEIANKPIPPECHTPEDFNKSPFGSGKIFFQKALHDMEEKHLKDREREMLNLKGTAFEEIPKVEIMDVKMARNALIGNTQDIEDDANLYIGGIDPSSSDKSPSAIVKRWADGTIESVHMDNLPRLHFLKEMMDVSQYYNVSNIHEKPKPYDILKLRTLTGKARKEMLASIENDCRAFLSIVGGQSIYIQGNVPSSKNSKSIGTYKKRNFKGELETKHTLMNSKTTQRYEKESRLAWHQNKDIFLDLAKNKSFPLMVEFTFIRESVRTFDLHNAIQYPADLMTANGWIPDDESAYFIPVFNPVVYYSKELAGVIIRVL